MKNLPLFKRPSTPIEEKSAKRGVVNRELLGIVGINLALILLILEVVPLLFYLVTEQRFIYTDNRDKTATNQLLEQIGVREQATGNNDDKNAIVERLHPFFGYVLKPGLFADNPFGLRVNNYGFFALHDYPFIRQNDNQFIIGIFGGSVAVDFANYEVTHKELSNTLIQQLRTVPELANKEFIILNFAHGGYKQPQQLLILNYFLSIGQELDLVVNIDGFNEVALPPLNNQASVPVSMPSFRHIQPLTALANTNIPVVLALAEMNETREKLVRQIQRLENCKLASCYAWNSYQVNQLTRRYQSQVSALDTMQIELRQNEDDLANSLISIPQNPQVLPDDIAFDKMVDIWFNSSQMIHQTLANKNIPYFHVIQPNQYHPTQRTFTAEEIAIFDDNPYIEGVRQGYPRLLARGEDLPNFGVNVINAVTVFDTKPETVYRDSCCHYTPRGQEIFTEYIGNSIVNRLQSTTP
ncbi:hypothetical protein [Limnospira platensis]|uniref:hypothetical protein n=1 Tax=Limnospira platensis TaxID=118562 RepID=UPI0002804741|nr:hypothetical protein SPLC1_S033620 [Arthrospira platensis C1]UWU50106.1 hypothetical protein APLC1_4994 [Arthrospira platensis C1]